jgi:DNA-binding response OmpR family regulator
VVDDDPDIADSVADVLRSGGYDVEKAANGATALRHVTTLRIDLVLLDWRLPDQPAGTMLVRHIRDALGPVPIVVLSADPTSLVEAREAAVSDYLPKPFEVADLLHLVDVYCPG